MGRCALVLVLMAAFAGTGCARREAPSPAGPATLVVGVSTQPDHLNPLVAGSAFGVDLCDLLFLRLAYYGPPPEFDYEPVLALNWELSEDRKVLTYHLRRDVVWSDGVPTTARDVAFTIERAKHPDVPYPGKSHLRRIAGCEVVDDWTVRVLFSEPSWEPIYDTSLHIVPAHLLEAIPPGEMMTSAFDRAPVGNGRWKLREWAREERVVLEANDTCALGRPIYDRVVFRVIPEETTLRTELLTGGVDVYDRHPNKWYREDSQHPELRFFRMPDKGYTFIAWNHRNALFQDVRVRKALTMATDRPTIIQAFRGGFGTVSAVPLFAEHPDYNPDVKPLPFDPAGAGRLLDEAGWAARDADGVRMKDGKRFEFTYTLISGNEISEEIATMTQAEFAKLGIAVRTEAFEWTVYLDRIRNKEFDATILARRGTFLYDPEDLFHTRQIEGPYNDISFGHPVTDSLIDLAKATPDRVARRAIWWRFFEEFDRLQPVSVLYVSETSYPVRRDRVAHAEMDLRGAYQLLYKWVPAGRGGR